MPNMSATQGPLSVDGLAIGQLSPHQVQRGVFVLLALAVFPSAAIAVGEPIQFAPPIKYTFSSPIFHICAADFNGDRFQDLAMGSGGTEIWTNDGSGILRFFTSVSSGPLAEFNNDNRMDLVTATSGPVPAVWLNNGSGFTRTNLVAAMSFQAAAAAGDLNGDGKFDLVLQGNNYLQTFLGQANGAFTLVTIDVRII